MAKISVQTPSPDKRLIHSRKRHRAGHGCPTLIAHSEGHNLWNRFSPAHRRARTRRDPDGSTSTYDDPLDRC